MTCLNRLRFEFSKLETEPKRRFGEDATFPSQQTVFTVLNSHAAGREVQLQRPSESDVVLSTIEVAEMRIPTRGAVECEGVPALFDQFSGVLKTHGGLRSFAEHRGKED